MVTAPSRLRARPQIENRSSRVRRSQRPVSYNECSSDDDETATLYSRQSLLSEASPDLKTQRAPQRKRAKVAESTQTSRSPNEPAKNHQVRSGLDRSKSRKHAKQETKKAGIDELDLPLAFLMGTKMPWQTLPFHILTSIFAYASSPILSNDHRPRPSVKWLVQAALICKSFTEPALTVLYFALSIQGPSQARQLTLLLKSESEASLVKYRHKIRYLYVQNPDMWTGKFANTKFSDLAEIIKFTPKLRSIHLGMHQNVAHRYYPSRSVVSRTGEAEIFASLRESNAALEGWTWNFQVDEPSFKFSAFEEFQRAGLFRRLKSITISNVCTNKPDTIFNLVEGSLPIQVLTDTLQSMSALNKVCLSNIQADCDTLVPGLPDRLKSLVIISCPLLRSSDIHAYLSAKGRHLEKLILNHNHSLALSFLTDLSWECPQLKIFEMDLLFHSQYMITHHFNPKFDSLLLPDERPSWPPSIQRIELLHLRKWETAVADAFFSSLAENSGLLLDLRHLKIKASLDESSWRNRAAFRDKWVSLLEKLYLRPLDFPDKSGRATQAVKIRNFTQDRQSSPSWRDRTAQMTDDSSSSHIAFDNDSSAGRRSLRKRRAADYNEASSEIEDAALPDDVTHRYSDGKRHTTFQHPQKESAYLVQGRCHIVDIVIDNLRPMEEQLHESDFLDEEFSGDEDWNANDDDITSYPYARRRP